MLNPRDATHALKGVGPKLAKQLSQCDLHTIQDLVFHLPFRYQDRTRITPLRDLRENDWAVIQGHVTYVKQQRNRLQVVLESYGSQICLIFFHVFPGMSQRFQLATEIQAFGEVRWFNGQKSMAHPEWSVTSDTTPLALAEHLTPIYTTTQGLSQKRLRECIMLALAALPEIPSLPKELFQQYESTDMPFDDVMQCLRFLHQPPPEISQETLTHGEHPAQRYLAIEEMLAYALVFSRARAKHHQYRAPQYTKPQQLIQHWQQTLPFALTSAQSRAIEDIHHDLEKPWPMQRLLQGDVGSGKTLVAIAASLSVIAHGSQVAVMAPTELLAEQLFAEFRQWITPLGFKVGDLLGKHTERQKQQRYEAINAGNFAVIVGTHALFQQKVNFHQLGLLIIDEQHRFGVKQRLALQKKGRQSDTEPHQLLMTATPIPRTLAMSNLTHLAVSILDERPPGRLPIQTVVIDHHQRVQVIDRLSAAIKSSKQAYWVCPLVEQSEELQCEAAEGTTECLKDSLPGARIGMIHGRMKADQKSTIMAGFLAHELDVLVATTVIEVGVNVPNATLIIIDNAERLGLAQLHQLRGRVGRDQQQSYCVLLAQSPLSDIARQRLQLIRQHQDGFKIAEADLSLRGAGEMIGTKQTGLMQFKVTTIEQFKKLSPKLNQWLGILHDSYPQHEDLLLERWIGEKEEYISA